MQNDFVAIQELGPTCSNAVKMIDLTSLLMRTPYVEHTQIGIESTL